MERRIRTCDHENRGVKKLATELVRKVDKWDDMRHRERLPASREIGKSWEAGGTAVGDEAHLQQALAPVQGQGKRKFRDVLLSDLQGSFWPSSGVRPS